MVSKSNTPVLFITVRENWVYAQVLISKINDATHTTLILEAAHSQVVFNSIAITTNVSGSQAPIEMLSNIKNGVDFSDILNRSRELRDLQEASARSGADSIPRLERALPQIDKESRRLVATSQPETTTSDEQALRFLSERGIPTGHLAETLQAGAILEDAFTSYTEPPDTDVSGHLERMQEDIVIDAMERALERTKNVSRRHIATRSDADWDATKRERVSVSAMKPATRRTPSVRTPSTAPGGVFASPFRFVRDTDAPRAADASAPVFESVVRKAVFARSNPADSIPVATCFDDAFIEALAPRGPRSATRGVQNLHAAFNVLRYMSGEFAAKLPREGEYSGLLLPNDRRRTMLGALRFICLQFREDKMRHEVASNPVQAQRGGVPGIQADVRAYLNIMYARGTPDELLSGPLVHGVPLWSQIYYCLRSGDLDAAHALVLDSLKGNDFDNSVVLYEECLRSFISSGDQRRIPDELLTRLVQDYGLRARNGGDPYKRVCFVVIARLDPAAGDKMALQDVDYDYLFRNVEDYLWLQLSIARIDDDSSLPNALSSYELPLRNLQQQMRDFGPAHFDPRGDQAVFYAHILLLTGQFSEAITYLDRVTDSSAEAVHIAFVLYYYGMLREGDTGEEEDNHRNDALSHQCLEVDYPSVLWRYVMQFAATDPTCAVVYLFTVRDSGKRNELLTKLLLETKQLKILVGAVGLSEPDPSLAGAKSVFEEMWPLAGREGVTSGGWLGVAEAAAVMADEKGDTETAISLFNVCRKYGKVALLLINRLSAELTSRGAPIRERLERDARAFVKKLSSSLMDTRQDGLLEACMPTLEMMLRLYTFFAQVWAKDYQRAWTVLQETGLLPMNAEQLVMKTRELRPGAMWRDKLSERIPDIVLATMECIVEMYGEAQRKRELRNVREMKEKAKVLINFSAMMPGSSADLSARLMRYEVMLT